LRLGVQLFRITEVLRQHFIENPDAFGFDIICEAIDDSWQRLLSSAIERDIKERLGKEASTWALRSIFEELLTSAGDKEVRNLIAVGMTKDGRSVCAALNSEGRLLGASRDHRPLGDKTTSDTLAKLLTRSRPTEVVAIRTEETGELVENVVRATIQESGSAAEITIIDDPCGKTGICESEWVKTKCADLDRAMRHVYAAALIHVRPLTLVAEIGPEYFDVHPLQQIVPRDELNAVITRVATQRGLSDGVPVRDIADSVLTTLPDMPEDLPQAIRARDIAEPFGSKADLLSVKGMTERIYRNIAGYVVLPVSSYALDTTLVHPYFYEAMEDMARDLKVSTEGMIVNPDVLNAYTSGDFAWQLYVRKHVIRQLVVGQKVAQTRQLPRRKLRLDELEEGMIVQGKVTNISPFGAFVNINAVCDGLIHISQLADSYVENPEQVVSVGDTVNVRIVKVDTKKRRISLSMKGQGQAPRVRPSANHITNLIDHFSNR
ncbi:MAG: S1 RNA-binding domain-containing protein, partial [Chitinivibrionales bacterium]|nr:S1 RNA-binding domain-containing protein [Chitinivibrionales bacterium]